ncbi:MAG: family 16 glycoside hydrolase [Planctomycetota bacterium]
MCRWMACLALALAGSLTAQTKVLFDGRSLDGWRGDPRYWSVVDGEIVGRSTAEQPLTRNTFLVLDGEYDDFELRLRVKITGGNSGIQFRSREVGDFVVAGPQADLEYGPNHTGMIYEERGRGIMVPRGESAVFEASGKTKVVALGDAARLQSFVKRGDWNDYVVRAVGNRVVLAINGQVTAMLEDRDEGRRSLRGIFALQLHSGPPMEVRYRDVRITELAAEASPLPGDVGVAQWIWSRQQPLDDESIVLRRRFDLPVGAKGLVARATCDNVVDLRLGDKQLLRSNDWQTLATVRKSEALPAGTHELVASCTNEGGPAAFACHVEFQLEDGSKHVVVSDLDWEWVDAKRAAEPQRAVSFGFTAAPGLVWGDPFQAKVATGVESLRVMDGFVAELVHSAQPGEGSWVALDFDSKGRAVVARERGPLARIVIGPDGGVAFEPLDETPRGSMGFCFDGETLWMQGNDSAGYALFRLRDGDGDDHYEDIAAIARLGAGGEHGSHAVAVGPDGAIWLMNGNMSAMPKASVISASSPLRWQAEDELLPRLEDPRGHAVGVRVPGGRVFRVDPTSGQMEVFAAGFRNAYDFAFSPAGELFTFDSDMEWDIGLPWYRPTRVYHVVSGADFGWRTGAGKQRAHYPDTLPPLVDVGLSSPTGVLFGTKLRYPAEMRRALYVADWAYGRILAVHMTPDGASYRGSFENFVTGKPLNVADMAAGPDGALWFITGGRGTQSGLYRVRAIENDSASAALEFVESAPHRQRRVLEADHGGPREGAVDRAWPHLGSSDRFLAHAARVALEAQPVDKWRDRVNSATSADLRLRAQLALVRVGTAADRVAVCRRLASDDLAAAPSQWRRDALRVFEVAFARGVGDAADAVGSAVIATVRPLLADADFEIVRGAARLLAALGATDLPGALVPRLAQLELAPALDLAYALRVVHEGWTDDLRGDYFTWLGRAKVGTGGMSFRGYVESIETDALEHAPAADREALRAKAKAPPRVERKLDPEALAARAWSRADLEPYFPLVDQRRDYDRGALAFQKALCAVCHRFDGAGGDIGPDLTAVASRFSRRDLLTTILEPSRDISDQYQSTTLKLRDGTSVAGRIAREDQSSVEVVIEPVSGQSRIIARSDIVSREASTVSPMPQGLLNLLTLEEVLDLFAWLEAGGNRNHPAFGK